MARRGAKKGGRAGEDKVKKRTPRTRRPPGMTLEEWQVALRREFGREQKFRLRNTGSEPFFSEYLVTNPQTGRTYRVAVRGTRLGENYCSCPDFAVNTLGTCKHIEFTLAQLSRRRGGKRALARGFRPAYSEVYLRYGARRDVVFRPGLDCPRAMETFSRRFFRDGGGVLTKAGYARFDEFARRAGSDDHEVRIYEDARAFVAEVRDRKALDERVAKAFPKELHSIVEFVDRFRLGPLFRFLAEHQHADEHGRVVGYRNLS
jgi:hypothetical protein